MIKFIIGYLIPCILGMFFYTYLIYKNRCCGNFFGWVLCVMPMINLIWAIILIGDTIYILYSREIN